MPYSTKRPLFQRAAEVVDHALAAKSSFHRRIRSDVPAPRPHPSHLLPASEAFSRFGSGTRRWTGLGTLAADDKPASQSRGGTGNGCTCGPSLCNSLLYKHLPFGRRTCLDQPTVGTGFRAEPHETTIVAPF